MSKRFMPKLHVHIGHHFFGSGNVGDDLMLAGFLEAARPAWLRDVTLTCCTAQDARSQRRRFPEIEWLPYDPVTRADCIARSDVWLGLGDTPFQATGGHTWFLDHLCAEAAGCREHGVPMYYLGVGVNERAVTDYAQTRVIVGQAERIWMRDEASVEMLGSLTVPGQATAHADLAHLALAAMQFPPPEEDTLGLVLNFEDPGQFQVDQLSAVVRAAHGWRVRWLAQEVRPLPGSETVLHGLLPPEARADAPLRVPDYAGAASARDLLAAWAGVGGLFVSRYHAAVIGAWMGGRVAVFARNDKVAGAARQLGLSTVAGLDDTAAILRTVAAAQPAGRRRLGELTDRAREACEEFFAVVHAPRYGSKPVPSVGGVLISEQVDGDLRMPLEPSIIRQPFPSATISTAPGGRHPPNLTGTPPPTAGNGSLAGAIAAEAQSGVSSVSPVEFSPMSSLPPRRILLLRPDTYGDLLLFEPIPRILRDAWPQTEVAVLIREPYQDLVPLLQSEGIRWLTTTCNPYRQGPGENPAALAALRQTMREFAPDCVVAACAEQTWLEATVAAFLPEARQISLGGGLTDPVVRASLDAVMPVDWSAIYPEKVAVEPEQPEWEKNLRLAGVLLGGEAPRWWPAAHVPEDAGAWAAQFLAESGLVAGAFVVCAAAGTANVPIKSWPAEHYGETLAWLERERGIRALLIGHVSEREHLETVREAARQKGGEPALWLGQDGEMPVAAGLLAAALFYFGNDTGALHLAAALGRSVLAVYGGGTWPRFRPVARRSLSVVQPLPCFGCGWNCYFVDAPCVRTISLGSVQRALEQFLRDDAAGRTIFEAEGLDSGTRALIHTATPRLRFLVEDGADRMRQVRRLTVQTESLSAQLQTDDAEHRRQVGELEGLLRASETDRDARLRQVEELTRQAKELSNQLQTDDAEHRRQVGEWTDLLSTSESDRHARLLQIEELTVLLRESEADRAARGELLGVLTGQISAQDKQLREQEEQRRKLTAELTPHAFSPPLPGQPDAEDSASPKVLFMKPAPIEDLRQLPGVGGKSRATSTAPQGADSANPDR